jgi:hypothetical protein
MAARIQWDPLLKPEKFKKKLVRPVKFGHYALSNSRTGTDEEGAPTPDVVF